MPRPKPKRTTISRPASSPRRRDSHQRVSGVTGAVQFVASGLNYDATVRNLELIGEAATHVPEAVRQANPQIPWRLVIATRNRLIHGYLGVDSDTLWSIVRSDVPVLLPKPA
ncbi:DUF86 domain-containing protein [Immundisolibacter cernigliae]|uniref:HepT-like ribonuclease domain-containing protein n=1 Tax=Immundisolibacter cernigliae TaxID=1810504 RepID=UPI0021500BBE|nr:DUF86 domain-containing protein [Immundisolibacter cernigliae]